MAKLDHNKGASVAEAADSVDGLLQLALVTSDASASALWVRRQNSLRTNSFLTVEDGHLRSMPLSVDMSIGEGVAGRSALLRGPIYISDLSSSQVLEEYGISGVAHPGVVDRFEWYSCAASPIVIDGFLWGVLAVYSKKRNAFHSELSIPLEIIGERIAAHLKIGEQNLRHQRMVAIGGSFLSSAHDIREQVLLLQTMLKYVRRNLGAISREDAQAKLGTAIELAQGCQDLIENSLRRVNTAPPRPRLTPVSPMIEAVKSARMDVASSRGVRLTTKCQSGLAAVCSETDLSAALLNLVDNAIYFVSSSNGKSKVVHVEATIIRDSTGEATRTCCIDVCDSGPGIRAEERGRIFDFGYSTKPAGRGLGIGLAHVASIVEGSGGTIEVADVRGWSTVLRILLTGSYKSRNGSV
jgi:signal transduction histidine kinase